MSREFWKISLDLLSPQEWESLCDGCGKCCYFVTAVLARSTTPCPLLKDNRCSDYLNRYEKQPRCKEVTYDLIESGQLPETCAYVRRYHGYPLEKWQIEKIQ